MKTLVASLFLLTVSLSQAESSSLLLDAACKVECLVSKEIVGAGQGGVIYREKKETIYFDLSAKTRSQIDKATATDALTNLCRESFTQEATALKSDCLYFKN